MSASKYYLLWCLIISHTLLFGQKILLVDDNDYVLYNSDTLINHLKATNYTIDVHNIEKENGLAPSLSKMSAYDMVIWYASTDGVLLNFWEDDTQKKLIQYLNSGKAFWLIGTDILYAKYGLPPYTFLPTEFAYDYLGISAYNVQSYGDDNNQGCPQMDLQSGAPSGLPSMLHWIFPTLWWADGCILTDHTIPFYAMGPSSYKLAGNISMHYFMSGKVKSISTFFDPAFIDNRDDSIDFLKSTIKFLLIETSTNENFSSDLVKVWPTITSGFLNVELQKSSSLVLYNNTGIKVLETRSEWPLTSLDLTAFQKGLYYLRVLSENGSTSTHSVIKL